MHGWSDESERLAQHVLAYALERVRMDPVPLDGPRSPAELDELAGRTVTAEGIGGDAALAIFRNVLAPACISTDHPRNLSFIPCAPTEAAILFDLVVGASSIYGGIWLEASGAVHAENEALAWLCGLAGFPDGAGGVFVQGGSIANLSALVVARDHARETGRLAPGARPQIVGSAEAHSSITSAARVIDAEVIAVPVGPSRRLDGAAIDAVLATQASAQVIAIVATAGTTNLGIVDDLQSISDVASRHGIWLHVDGAYGGAALAAPSARERFAGVERANSLVVDPHKWLFAPFDCAALCYADPTIARRALAQHAAYLEPLESDTDWNPSDFALQLSRRARGLPFWFSLATHGTNAYAVAIEQTLEVARYAAAAITARPGFELICEPDLSVLCFTRTGWSREHYEAWSHALLSSGFAFVTPSRVDDVSVARFAIVNPLTTAADIDAILDTMVTPTAGHAT